MKIVDSLYNGKPGVGLVSADLQQIQPFDLPLVQRERGALALIEMQARGKALPVILLPVKISEVQITAPLLKPRRNFFASERIILLTPESSLAAASAAAPRREKVFQIARFISPKYPNR